MTLLVLIHYESGVSINPGGHLAQIIDGKSIAKEIKSQLRLKVDQFVSETGVVPQLATLLVGEDPASQVYIRNKIKSTEACGMVSMHQTLPDDTTQEALLARLDELNQDPKVHAILVQMPLPKQIDEQAVIEAIDPKKDVDGFHPDNVGRLTIGQPRFVSCTPKGVMRLLEHCQVSVSGKDVLVIGRSNIVGKPQALLMLNANATVTVAHSRTKDLKSHVSQADIVVVAVGRAKMIPGEWLKEGAVVIDVGVNRMDNGKLCGDVDFESAQKVAGWITPVPGGVGPMTIAMLMENTFEASQLQVKGLTR